MVRVSAFDVPLDQESGAAGRRLANAGRLAELGTSGCSPDQASDLELTFPFVLQQGLACLERYGATGLAATISNVYTIRGVTLVCESAQPPDALASVPRNSWTQWNSPLHIRLYPLFFQQSLARQQATLFHEMLHSRMGWQHHPDEGEGFDRRSEVDPVRACTSLCFPEDDPPTRCACATCLGTNKCDERCLDLPDCDPAMSFECPCPRGPNAHKRFPKCSDCLARCPSGLACFGYAFCIVVGDVSCGEPATCP